MKLVFDLFKLRIGLAIALTALAGAAVAPGAAAPGAVAAMALAVLVASAAAGAFNQYIEVDLDRRMSRTRGRAFATGRLAHHRGWAVLIVAMVAGATIAAAAFANPLCALYTFLGAFFYGVVYTVWLKRRTWMNIVIGGLAGSFAVLAGAAAVSPSAAPGPLPLALAWILFLWTPPHFWSLAIACREDYERAGVPMLPVVAGDARASRVVLASAMALTASSLLPLAFGMGWAYGAAACAGGWFFLRAARGLARTACSGAPREAIRKAAWVSFHASLVQLSFLLVGAILDRAA